MNHRIEEHDLLAWIEGELAPERARIVESALDADPGLRAWAEAVARDRSLLSASGADAEARAPRGLVEDAIAIVERRALVGADTAGSQRSHRRLRITPVRMGIAASLLMGISLLSLWPLLTGSSTPGRRASHGPVAVAPSPSSDEGPAASASQSEPADDTLFALADTRDGEETSALRSSDLLTGAAPVVADADAGWQSPDDVGRGARRSLLQVERAETSEQSREINIDPASGERVARIAMTDDVAAALLRQGRLVLLIETTDLTLAEGRVWSLADRGASGVSIGATTPRDIAAALGDALVGHLPAGADTARLIHYTVELNPTSAALGSIEMALAGDGVQVRRVALPAPILAPETPVAEPGSAEELLTLRPRSASLPVVVIRPDDATPADSDDGADSRGADGPR
ncbi:MAG: hypothetical protein EA376_04295 [Phycisphaeraceae bacterium]|nr:MAG: hypothetical protein EA376_04295 [Phycisphaeraceae bacterium]